MNEQKSQVMQELEYCIESLHEAAKYLRDDEAKSAVVFIENVVKKLPRVKIRLVLEAQNDQRRI